MGISTSILADHGVLKVKYSPDPVTADDLFDQRTLVAETLSRNDISKVLIDASALVHFPSPITVFEHINEIVADERLRNAKFATVCASFGEDERFLENSAVNRGINLRCFTSREKALSWLEEHPDQPGSGDGS